MVKEIICSTDNLYDKAIEFYNDVFEKEIKEFKIIINIKNNEQIEMVQTFISLVEDAMETFKDLKVDFDLKE